MIRTMKRLFWRAVLPVSRIRAELQLNEIEIEIARHKKKKRQHLYRRQQELREMMIRAGL